MPPVHKLQLRWRWCWSRRRCISIVAIVATVCLIYQTTQQQCMPLGPRQGEDPNLRGVPLGSLRKELRRKPAWLLQSVVPLRHVEGRVGRRIADRLREAAHLLSAPHPSKFGRSKILDMFHPFFLLPKTSPMVCEQIESKCGCQIQRNFALATCSSVYCSGQHRDQQAPL